MQFFENKTFKRVISLLSLVAMLIFMNWGIGKVLEPITYATYFNHDISTIEESENGADIVFIGSSRVYRTFVPQIFEDGWNVGCVVNAGSSSQPLCGTYYQLKDLIERVHPRKVYIGVTLDSLTSTVGNSLRGRLIVYDRLSLKNKILMGLNCFSLKEKAYLFNTYRFKNRFNKKTIMSNMKAISKLKASNYNSYSKTSEYYADKGFVYNYDTYVTGTIPIKGAEDFSEELIIEEYLHYLDSCIELCKNNNIEVNLVSGVTSVMRMYASTGYQPAVDFYNSYALKNGIKYYNLNYLKNREHLIPDELMHDYNHVNGKGAYVVSALFANLVKREDNGEDISSFFYNSLADFKQDVKRIVAVGAEITIDGKDKNYRHIKMQSLHNDDVKAQYRVSIKYPGSDKYKILSDWSVNSDFDVRIKEKSGYIIKVEAGTGDKAYGLASQKYKY
jgi:hypothetical protein